MLGWLRRWLSAESKEVMFADRRDAAAKLAERLSGYGGRNALVLGVPRGAVPMARAIADQLGAEVDVVLVRKLGAPDNPEFAVGAVDESGWRYLAEHAGAAGASPAYLEQETQRQLETLRQRRAQYTAQRAALDPRGRVVIVVDDGLATGSTMIAALHALRSRGPARLICAVPVAPPDTVALVAQHCDEVVCLETPEYFAAVGQFYRHFPQVSDQEVIAALAQGGTAKAAGPD